MNEKMSVPTPPEQEPGENWGEMTRRIIVEALSKAGDEGISGRDLLPLLREQVGSDLEPQDADLDPNELVVVDDIAEVLKDLEKEGLIQTVDGRISLQSK